MLGRTALCLLFVLGTFLSPQLAKAGEQEEAANVANAVMTALGEKRYEVIWDDMTSDVFKQKTSRDAFLSGLSSGREELGDLTGSQLIDVQSAEDDPQSGYKGTIYSFTYLNSYSVGQFHERIIVLKDDSGAFGMGGLWGQPATSQ